MRTSMRQMDEVRANIQAPTTIHPRRASSMHTRVVNVT
jgi:hypothetical protein